jgi:hypothetical protein
VLFKLKYRKKVGVSFSDDNEQQTNKQARKQFLFYIFIFNSYFICKLKRKIIKKENEEKKRLTPHLISIIIIQSSIFYFIKLIYFCKEKLKKFVLIKSWFLFQY